MSGSGADRPRAAERIAAAAALVALLAAIALLLIGALDNLAGVLVSLAGLASIVVGGWYAVSRRGPVRTVAIIVVVGGLAVFVAGFFVDDLTLTRAISVLALAGLSVAAARFALGRTTRALREAIPSGAPVSRATRPVLLMNPRSGGGKVERFHLVDECRDRDIEPVVLQPGDDLVQLAEDAIARGADVIGMAGGDGSQALVATVCVRHDVPHVVVPAGTRNHLALDLGLDRDDVVGALDAFGDGVERRVDLARINGRVFVNNASLGIYAKIVQSPEYRDAKMQTAASMLPDLLGPDAEPLDLRFSGPDGEEHRTAHMVLVSNDPYQLDELGGRGTRERMDLGVLGVAALRISSASDAQRFIALDAVGQIRRFPGWVEWSTPRFEIGSGAPVEVGVDGEALSLEPPLVFESMPAALRVRLPLHAPGSSPAARRISRTSIAELIEVAAGRSPFT